MTVQERLQQDMTKAMRGKDELRLNTLRAMKTAVRNKEVEKRKPLEENECQQVFGTLIKQRRDAAEQFTRGGREDAARRELSEIGVIEEYLPAFATDADIEEAIQAAMSETGANSVKQMGPVMKAATAKLAGRRYDGKTLSDQVRARLGG